ncbi:MAG: hypothetical protein MJK12_04905 [Colwellia sp.]|nr:hypothetical protein [Colwellia sp.]
MKDILRFPNQYLSKISVILLIAYLCAFVSHAQHFDLVVDVNETQQCQLCQNNIDTPPSLSLSILPTMVCYQLLVNTSITCCFISTAHQRPHLRAPPVY